MMLYTSRGPAPNPRRVAIALHEKGVDLPVTQLALAKRQQRDPAYLAVNPLGKVPALRFDDGEVLTESIAICRWLEGEYPEPALFGRTTRERARTEMRLRQVELLIGAPLTAVWMHDHPWTEPFLPDRHAAWGAANRPRYMEQLHWLDAQLAGQPHLAGDDFGIADIAAVCTIDFGVWIGLPPPPECAALDAWRQRVGARASVAATGFGTGHGW